MGSPVSVVLAEIVMQYVEKHVMENVPCPVLFWKRYVDDVITAIPKDQTEDLLQHLNSFS
jgi:hypothetical protein